MAKKLLETWSNVWLRIARSPKGGVVCTPLVQRDLEDAFQLHSHSTRTGNTGSTRWVSPRKRKPLIARSLLPRKCLAQKLPHLHFHRDDWLACTDRRQLHHLILFLSVSTLFLLLLGIDMARPGYQEQGLHPRRPTTLTRRLALGAGESWNRSRFPGGVRRYIEMVHLSFTIPSIITPLQPVLPPLLFFGFPSFHSTSTA